MFKQMCKQCGLSNKQNERLVAESAATWHILRKYKKHNSRKGCKGSNMKLVLSLQFCTIKSERKIFQTYLRLHQVHHTLHY